MAHSKYSDSDAPRSRRLSIDSIEERRQGKSAVTSVIMRAVVGGILDYKASDGNKLTCIAGAAVGAISAKKAKNDIQSTGREYGGCSCEHAMRGSR